MENRKGVAWNHIVPVSSLIGCIGYWCILLKKKILFSAMQMITSTMEKSDNKTKKFRHLIYLIFKKLNILISHAESRILLNHAVFRVLIFFFISKQHPIRVAITPVRFFLQYSHKNRIFFVIFLSWTLNNHESKNNIKTAFFRSLSLDLSLSSHSAVSL